MLSKIAALASVLTAGVFAQSNYTSNHTDKPANYQNATANTSPAIAIVYDWRFNDRDADEIGDLMKLWHDHFAQTDVYTTGTHIATVGWEDRGEQLHQKYMFKDEFSLQHFINTVMASDKLMNATGQLKDRMQWSGDIYSNQRPNVTNLTDIFPNTLFSPYNIEPFHYGPWINGLLNFKADRDSENGPMVMNVALKTNDTDKHARSKMWMQGLTNHLQNETPLFGTAILHFKVEEVPSGFVGTIVFAGPQAYDDYNRQIDVWGAQARQNKTIGDWSNHTDFVFMQSIGFDNDLRETNLDRLANEYYIGAPNLAIYGETTFGFIELETYSASWEDLAAVAFLLDIGAGYWNFDTWNAANDDEWTMVFMAQFVAGTFGLLALLGQIAAGGKILLTYSVLHMFFEIGILGLTFVAESDTANTTNSATILSYVAGGVGFCAALAANVVHRVL